MCNLQKAMYTSGLEDLLGQHVGNKCQHEVFFCFERLQGAFGISAAVKFEPSDLKI